MKKSFLITALALIVAICSCGLFACSNANTGKAKDPGVYYKKYAGDTFYTVYDYVDETGVETLDLGEVVAQKNPNDTIKIGRIQAGAFDGNANIKTLIIPDSVEVMDEGALSGMRNLESLTLPFVGRTAVADNHFNETAESSDKSVDVERTFGYIFGTSDFSNAVRLTGAYNGGSGSKTYYVSKNLKTVNINPKVNDYNIPMYAFSGNKILTTINFNDKVTEIGEGAFKGCEKLATVTGANNIVSIFDSAFYGCKALENMVDASELIGSSAYENSGVTTVTLNSDDVIYGSKAFAGSGVTAVTVNTDVPYGCFMGCTKLETVTITANVKVHSYSFANLGELKTCTVTYTGCNPTFMAMWKSNSPNLK